jgi:hypothetical protein
MTRSPADHWETDHCAKHFFKACFTLLNNFLINYFAQNRLFAAKQFFLPFFVLVQKVPFAYLFLRRPVLVDNFREPI